MKGRIVRCGGVEVSLISHLHVRTVCSILQIALCMAFCRCGFESGCGFICMCGVDLCMEVGSIQMHILCISLILRSWVSLFISEKGSCFLSYLRSDLKVCGVGIAVIMEEEVVVKKRCTRERRLENKERCLSLRCDMVR